MSLNEAKLHKHLCMLGIIMASTQAMVTKSIISLFGAVIFAGLFWAFYDQFMIYVYKRENNL